MKRESIILVFPLPVSTTAMEEFFQTGLTKTARLKPQPSCGQRKKGRAGIKF